MMTIQELDKKEQELNQLIGEYLSLCKSLFKEKFSTMKDLDEDKFYIALETDKEFYKCFINLMKSSILFIALKGHAYNTTHKKSDIRTDIKESYNIYKLLMHKL